MSLQLILGSAGTGKTRLGYETILRESAAHPERRYIVIVPEQFSMQTQKELAALHPGKGILNIEVLSFQRLAYRVFSETGGADHPVLEETGKSLVIQRVVQEQAKKLKLLGGNLKRAGAAAQMKSLVSELMQYQVGAEELGKWAEEAKDKPLLSRKLKEVETIYRGFLEFLNGRYITGEEILGVLCGKLAESELIRGSTVLLDGFSGFTPVQNQVVGELLRLCRSVLVTVTIDSREDPFAYEGPHRLFSVSQKMIRKLARLCEEAHAEIEEPVRLKHGPLSRFAPSGALVYLERHIFRYGNGCYPGKQNQISIRSEENPRRELEAAARMIRRMVREEGRRYREFAVVTGDLAAYAHYARQVFQKLDIPCFVDEKHSILMNPAVEFLRSALELAAQDFSYASVFRYLRCGMCGIQTEEADELENYVLALGIRGQKGYREPWTRVYPGMDEERLIALNGFRQRFWEETGTFVPAIQKSAQTAGERTVLLYRFLEQNRIQEKLREMEQGFRERGDLAMAREYAQVYEIIVELMEKLVEVLGEEEMRLPQFQELLEAGLQETKVGTIPPSADQVVLGDIERTRLMDIRFLFFVGINEGIIPKAAPGGGVLSEADREYLYGRDIELAPTAREEMYRQRFFLYRSLTRPSEGLFLSYSRTNSKGEALLPAYLIGLLRRLFPDADRQPEGGTDGEAAYEPGKTLAEAAMKTEEETAENGARKTDGEEKTGKKEGEAAAEEYKSGEKEGKAAAEGHERGGEGREAAAEEYKSGEKEGEAAAEEHESGEKEGKAAAEEHESGEKGREAAAEEHVNGEKGEESAAEEHESGEKGREAAAEESVSGEKEEKAAAEEHKSGGKEGEAAVELQKTENTGPEAGTGGAIGETAAQAGLLREAETPEDALESWVCGMRAFLEGDAQPGFEALSRWYLENEAWRKRLGRLINAAYYTGGGDTISRAAARALYGNELTNSATRLEQFAACAFAHFVRYGLALTERRVYEFGAADMGSILHEALEQFAKKLADQGLRWRELTGELRDRLIDESVEEMIHDYGNTILHSSSRNQYMILRVKRILRRTVWALQRQVQKGSFEPGGFEVSFAMEDHLDAVNFEVAPGARLRLRGRIDRMDMCETDDKIYIRIIDYKSGNTSLDFVELYYGLQLQLVVYLNAAVELAQKRHPDKQVEPAGIFYYHIGDPLVSGSPEEGAEALEQKILKELKLDGLARAEEEVVSLMDGEVGPGSSSSVLPVGYNKNGTLTRYSQAAGRQDFETISRYTNRTIGRIGRAILEGEAEAAPYRTMKKEACTYCPYRGICGFDERLGFSYRELKGGKPQEILERMREEMEKWE